MRFIPFLAGPVSDLLDNMRRGSIPITLATLIINGVGEELFGPDPRKVDTSGVSYAALVSVAEVSASKTSGAERLHQECRRRVL